MIGRASARRPRRSRAVRAVRRTAPERRGGAGRSRASSARRRDHRRRSRAARGGAGATGPLADLRRKHVGDARSTLATSSRCATSSRPPGGARAPQRRAAAAEAAARGARRRAARPPHGRGTAPSPGPALATRCRIGSPSSGWPRPRCSSRSAPRIRRRRVVPSRAQPGPTRGAAGQGRLGRGAGPHDAGAPVDRRSPSAHLGVR